jgi:two-component system sensor histidine kinase CpxA
MRPRLSLFAKVLCLGFLNLTLLALVFVLFARIQFRLDAGSFLLAPAQNRILAMAHTLALELDEKPTADWSQTLERFSQANRVVLYLLNEEGEHVAGPQLQAPDPVMARIPRRQRPPRGDRPPDRPRPRREEVPKREAARRGPAPPLFLTATSDPTRYWAGVQIPVRQDRQENPKPGSLILMSTSLISSPLFFDPKPWLAVTLAVVLVSLVCWLPFIRGVTQSISQMRRAAGQIAEGRFEVHVADGRRDEIGQLGEEINRMAARLAGFVKGQKRFLGGIAHELCTPIATVQFGLGSLERRVGAEDRHRVADIQEEMQHMSALVNELLSFSRAGIAGVEVKLGEVNVASTVSRALEREAPADRQIQSSVDAGLNVWAEPEYLFRAISNLVRNALRYAGHAGPIQVAARGGEGRVWITVSDHGPGVPEALLDEIFAPFYRVDESRNQETGGVGLGLAIVKSCVEACEGVVRCRNRQPTGLEVEIELKAAGKL